MTQLRMHIASLFVAILLAGCGMSAEQRTALETAARTDILKIVKPYYHRL